MLFGLASPFARLNIVCAPLAFSASTLSGCSLCTAVGVGSSPTFFNPFFRQVPPCAKFVFLSDPCASGVGNKEDSIPFVGCAHTRSWKYIRLYFVPFSFQVSLHLVEYQPSIPINKPENIFAHDPFWANFSNNSKHFWPEVAFIFFPQPFPGCGVWLA
jgi:hypothetical protein